MTIEESYRYWKNRYEAAKDFRDPHWEMGELREHREWCEHMKNAYEALEKQIPKKPSVYERNPYRHIYGRCCPVCGDDWNQEEYGPGMECCWCCGQAIDWSMELDFEVTE